MIQNGILSRRGRSIFSNKKQTAKKAIDRAVGFVVESLEQRRMLSIPAMPSNLAATPNTSSIALTWTNNASNQQGFNIQRSTNDLTWSNIATGVTTTNWTDTTPTSGQIYYYQVDAYNTDGSSAYDGTRGGAATVVAYDGFNYSSESNWSGGNSGVGFASGWTITGPTTASIVSGSLTYGSGGNALTTSANRVTLTHGSKATDTLSQSVGSTGTTLWAGFEFSVYSTTTGQALGAEVDLGPSTNEVRMGTVYNGDINADVIIGSTNHYMTGTTPPTANTTYFVAYEIQYLTSGDVIKMFIDPTAGTQPTTASGTLTLPSSAQLSTTNILDLYPNTYYSVATYDELRLGSTYASVAPNQLIVPATPTGLTATPATTSVVLSWADATSPAAFNVQRSTDDSTWTTVATGVTATTWTDTNASSDTTYYYQVNAYNSAGSSAYSTAVSTLTLPAEPSGLTATPTTTTVALNWTSTSGETGFTILKSTDDANWTTVATGLTATTWTDTSVLADATYYYRVDAYNATGGSAYSNIVTSTIPSQMLDSIVVTPSAPTLAEGSTQQFSAAALDQFGNSMALPSDLVWSVSGPDGSNPGSINSSSGFYTAPATVGGPFTIVASSASTEIGGQATINVADAAGPVGIWQLNDGAGSTASDISGYDNNGALVNGPTWTTNTDGAVGLSFNGQGQYVDIPDNSSLDPTSQITVGAWINAADWDGTSTILQKGTAGVDQYSLAGDGNGNLVFDLAGVGFVSAAVPSTGTWHYVAATYDGSNLDLYIDGSLAASQSATGNITTTTGDLDIGDQPGDTNNSDSFNGTIENVCIYPMALSSVQIAANATAPTITTSPTAGSTTLTGNNTTLNANALAANGLDNLTYTWSTLSQPTGADAPIFSDNGDDTANNATVLFDQSGTYELELTVADGPVSTTSEDTVTIDVVDTLSELVVSPSSPTIAAGGTQQFSATAFDQFGNVISLPTDLVWNVSGPDGSDPGSIDSASGLYTAPTSAGGSFTITASSAETSFSDQATITVATQAGPVGDWQFNASDSSAVSDSSGYNNDGILVNNPVWSGSADGAVGLFFNGQGQYVDVSDDSTLDPTSQITVGAYFNATSWTQGSTLLQKGNTTTDQYSLGDDDGMLTFSVDGVGSVFTTLPSTGVWHSVVGTYDGSNLDLYVDGSLAATQSSTGSIATTTGDLNIGDAPGDTTNAESFVGTIAEANVYNYAVPADSVAAVFPAPTIVTAASASNNPVTTTTTNLSVLGASPQGETNLTYTWSVISEPVAGADPSFSDNGDNSAQNTTATFYQAGTYVLEVQISDGLLTTTSDVTVTVNQTLTSIFDFPGLGDVYPTHTYQLKAIALDQFGNAMATQPTFTWAISGPNEGTVNSTGLYSAPSNDMDPFAGGPWVDVSATVGSAVASSYIDIVGAGIPVSVVPNAVTNLTAELIGTDVQLTWNDSYTVPNTPDGFLIEAAEQQSNGTFTPFSPLQYGIVDRGITQTLATNLIPNVTYEFEVIPFNAIGDGAASVSSPLTIGYSSGSGTSSGGSQSGGGPSDGGPSAPPPVVSIQATADATAPTASGGTAVDGEFVVSRTPQDDSQPLTVDYQVDTTVDNAADPGVDYVALNGSVIIPAGSDQATIDVQPLEDNTATYPLDVRVDLSDSYSSSYMINSSYSGADVLIYAVTAPTTPVFAAIGDSWSAYEGTKGKHENFPQILTNAKLASFGPANATGNAEYDYDYATDGADMLTDADGTKPDLAEQVKSLQADLAANAPIKYVTILIGGNDFEDVLNNGMDKTSQVKYADIAAEEKALTAVANAEIAEWKTEIPKLEGLKNVDIVISTLEDLGPGPLYFPNSYGTPLYFSNAIAGTLCNFQTSINNTANDMTILNFADQEQDRVNTELYNITKNSNIAILNLQAFLEFWETQQTFPIGNAFTLNTGVNSVGKKRNNLWIDNQHLGHVAQGLWANAIISLFDSTFNANITLLTDPQLAVL